MKLLRFGEPSHEQPGLLDDQGTIRSLAGIVGDIDGNALDANTLQQLAALDQAALPEVDPNTRLGPCVGSVGKFVCIGLNYADHAEEANLPIPSEPEVFLKATSAICGPNDNIIQPRDSEKLDWELELGFVVGKDASYITEQEAPAHIAGYFISNDISERTFQFDCGSQWDKGKGCDTFGPIGPWLVTADEVPNPNNLNMWLEVNGHRFQDGNSKTMIFRPAFILSYLSRFMSLQAGDVISTGTPPGVGLGQKPPVYLNPGDVLELGIDGLGVQRQTVVTV